MVGEASRAGPAPNSAANTACSHAVSRAATCGPRCS